MIRQKRETEGSYTEFRRGGTEGHRVFLVSVGITDRRGIKAEITGNCSCFNVLIIHSLLVKLDCQLF
ncbi:hypothetical protein D9V86_11525 [Bacteroidetes/Chlorobi group bacterium ChocPot_Mid]|nr:MAG: hypothetical protein D9V86_11525 [Bacteroidetes/Chlorobi group bacterium ChocPot_Mid]